MTRLPSRARIEIPARDADSRSRSGFAVILSVIIVSGIALIASLAAASLYLNESRENSNRTAAVQADSSAYSCADIAMLRLGQNVSYTGNENVSVDKVVCTIEGVVAVGDARTVYAGATVNGLTSRLKVEIAEVYELFVDSWTEIVPQ